MLGLGDGFAVNLIQKDGLNQPSPPSEPRFRQIQMAEGQFMKNVDQNFYFQIEYSNCVRPYGVPGCAHGSY